VSRDYLARFQSKDTSLFCLQVMVGVIILYDHVHPMGAFAKKSAIDVSLNLLDYESISPQDSWSNSHSRALCVEFLFILYVHCHVWEILPMLVAGILLKGKAIRHSLHHHNGRLLYHARARAGEGEEEGGKLRESTVKIVLIVCIRWQDLVLLRGQWQLVDHHHMSHCVCVCVLC